MFGLVILILLNNTSRMSCIVRGCRSHSRNYRRNSRTFDYTSDISFHTFPKSDQCRQRWFDAVSKEKEHHKPSWKVCSRHFSPECFVGTNLLRARLSEYAVPALNLPARSAFVTDQPQTRPLPNPSSGDESDVGDDDSIYERDVSPIRTEDEGEATVPEGSSRRHEGCRCDVCRGQIFGFRYACVECANFDLCSACEARAHHAHHYVLRVPASKLHSDVRAVIQQIREQLLRDGNVEEEEDDTIEESSIKIEIKEEDLKQEDPLEETAEPSAGPLQGAGGQDVQCEESEDSTAVKYLGLSEGERRPVFEVPLFQQPAVPRVLSYTSTIMPHQPQVLSHQPQVLSPVMTQTLSHGHNVLSNQPQVLSHQSAVPQVQTHQPAVLSRQPKDQAKVQSKRKVLSHQPAVPQVISHQPAVPQVLSHEPQIPHATSHEKRPLMLEVQGLDTVRALAGASGATGAAGGGRCSGGKGAGAEGSYAVYTHHADPSRSPQHEAEGTPSGEPTGAGDETKPSRKKRKK